MDKQTAHRLLLKIQTFLEPESPQDLSRLEKDLLKSYILQLYDAVQQEIEAPPVSSVKSNEYSGMTKFDMPTNDPPRVQKEERTYVHMPEVKPQEPKDIPVEIRYTEPEYLATPPKVEQKPPQIPVVEPVKETFHTSSPVHDMKSGNQDEALMKLFEQEKNVDMPERFSHVPIPSIESAMGLNERIFTLKELFGGDKTLFDITCEQLNQLNSFGEAKSLLLNGAARQFKWGEADRLKMAEQFIRIVARRYPRQAHS